MSLRVDRTSLLGLGGALAGATGLPLVVLWMLDAGGPTSGIPALVGGIAALLVAAWLIVLRQRLIAAATSEPGSSESTG